MSTASGEIASSPSGHSMSSVNKSNFQSEGRKRRTSKQLFQLSGFANTGRAKEKRARNFSNENMK